MFGNGLFVFELTLAKPNDAKQLVTVASARVASKLGITTGERV